MQLNNVLLFFTSCIVGSIFLYWIIPLVKKKVFFYRHNARKKRLITHLLNKSIAQRSKFRLEILDGELKDSNCEGVCSISYGNQISIELIGTFAAQQIKGSTCRIFFQIMQADRVAFFHFASKCIETNRHGGITVAIFELPTQIDSGQKRKSIRCMPPSGAIQGVGLWKLNQNQPLPTKKKEIVNPMFAYRPRGENVMGLQNLSAGGMRLLFRGIGEDSPLKNFNIGEHLLCLLMINSPHAEKKTIAIWVSCRIVSQVYIEKDKSWQIGLRFITWAGMDDSKSEIIWFPNDENGCIPVLSSIVLRWHTQQNKKSK